MGRGDCEEVGGDEIELRAGKGVEEGDVGPNLIPLGWKVSLAKVVDALVKVAIRAES